MTSELPKSETVGSSMKAKAQVETENSKLSPNIIFTKLPIEGMYVFVVYMFLLF